MEFGGTYGFQHLPSIKVSSLENKEIQSNLSKWSLYDGMKIQAFSFSKQFKGYLKEEFLKEFMACPAVTSTLQKLNPDRSFSSIGIPAEQLFYSEVKCSSTSMALFDKIQGDLKGSVVKKSGSIVKCIPEYFQPKAQHLNGDGDGKLITMSEIEIADKLRKLIVRYQKGNEETMEDDDDDEEELLNVEERSEFLFQLFGHLVIGGSLCQYEDVIHPYLNVTKALYKDLVGVATSNGDDQNQLTILSHVFKIISASSPGLDYGENLLFHRPEYNNFFYVLVNPLKKICWTLYHHV